MRPLRYSINITLDGCADHRAAIADDELHEYHMQKIVESDALLLGRVTYQMMEEGWRNSVEPFGLAINAAKKYVVSSTLDRVNWNAELVRGDLETAVKRLKQQPGKGIGTGGLTLPRALAELGLIDEYDFVVQPRIAGHGPSVLAGLPKHIDLELVSRHEFRNGTVAMRYVPKR
jgi:dihydrofolate reductase